MSVIVAILYCTECNWMLRATWIAQELLQTFTSKILSVNLVPSNGGIFQILVNNKVIWDRKSDGGFPNAATLKERIRDNYFPEFDIRHINKT